MNPESLKTKSLNNGKSSKLLPALVLGINIAVVLYLFFANQESKQIISRQKFERRADSLTIKAKETEIVELQAQFKKIILENKSLGLTIETMESSVKELDKLRKDIRLGKVPLSDLDKRILAFQRKFIKGRMETDSMLRNNGYLSLLLDSINVINKVKEDSLLSLLSKLKGYEEKIEKGNLLKAENIMVSVLNSKGKSEKLRRNKYKVKNTKNIKVTFAIESNPLAKHCNRNLFLRIENPDGIVLTDKNQRLIDNKASVFSCEQVYYFNNTSQEISFMYNVDSLLKPGRYRLGLYNDSNKMGEEFIYLK